MRVVQPLSTALVFIALTFLCFLRLWRRWSGRWFKRRTARCWRSAKSTRQWWVNFFWALSVACLIPDRCWRPMSSMCLLVLPAAVLLHASVCDRFAAIDRAYSPVAHSDCVRAVTQVAQLDMSYKQVAADKLSEERKSGEAALVKQRDALGKQMEELKAVRSLLAWHAVASDRLSGWL